VQVGHAEADEGTGVLGIERDCLLKLADGFGVLPVEQVYFSAPLP
jgi:hypothetical protein